MPTRIPSFNGSPKLPNSPVVSSGDTKVDSPTAPVLPKGSTDSFGPERRVYVSGSTVRALGENVSSVTPVMGPIPPYHPKVFLRLMGPLGHFGPLGSYGPLSSLGPVGKNTWNPSQYISGSLGAEDWRNLLAGGPLGKDGPLGENGPLGDTAYRQTLPSINGSSKQLQAMGVFSPLGSVGPLGALGPLGPLGPVGAHGFTANAQGDYVNADGEVQRTVSVQWNLDERRTYELYENYSEDRARALGKSNDTSFMVEGRIEKTSGTDTYRFRSNEDQFVTVLVLPEKANLSFGMAMAEVSYSALWNEFRNPSLLNRDFARNFDNFDLEILDGKGKVIARSNLADGSDWVQLKVPAGTELQAQVRLKSSFHGEDKPYRLFVVGSTKELGTSDIRGAHQKPWETLDVDRG